MSKKGLSLFCCCCCANGLWLEPVFVAKMDLPASVYPYLYKEEKKKEKSWKQGNLKRRTTNLNAPIFPNVSCPPSLSANKAAKASFSSSFFLTAKGFCPWFPCWLIGVWEGAGEDDNEDKWEGEDNEDSWEGECISYVLGRLKAGEGFRCCCVWLDDGIEGDVEGAKGLFVLPSKK